jgi:hypothetical protein
MFALEAAESVAVQTETLQRDSYKRQRPHLNFSLRYSGRTEWTDPMQ